MTDWFDDSLNDTDYTNDSLLTQLARYSEYCPDGTAGPPIILDYQNEQKWVPYGGDGDQVRLIAEFIGIAELIGLLSCAYRTAGLQNHPASL